MRSNQVLQAPLANTVSATSVTPPCHVRERRLCIAFCIRVGCALADM